MISQFGIVVALLVSVFALAFTVGGYVALREPWIDGLEDATVVVTDARGFKSVTMSDRESDLKRDLPEIIRRTYVSTQGTSGANATVHSLLTRMGNKRDLQIAIEPFFVPGSLSMIEISLSDTGFNVTRDGSTFINHPCVITHYGLMFMGHALTTLSQARTSLYLTYHTSDPLWSYTGAAFDGRTISVPTFFLSWIARP